MDRLIKAIIGIIIGVIILYLISAILAVVVIIIAGGIKWYLNYRDSKIEWTEWKEEGTIPPLVKIVDGQKMFLRRARYMRFNRFTKTWHSEIIADPVWRPVSEAGLWDKYELQFR